MCKKFFRHFLLLLFLLEHIRIYIYIYCRVVEVSFFTISKSFLNVVVFVKQEQKAPSLQQEIHNLLQLSTL